MGTCGTQEGDVKTIVQLGLENGDSVYGEGEKKRGVRTSRNTRHEKGSAS